MRTILCWAALALSLAGSYNGSALVTERRDGHRWRLTRYGSITGPPSVSCAAACVVVASGAGPRWLRLRT